MKELILLLIVFFASPVYAQKNSKTYVRDYIPTDLNDAINYLNCSWSTTDKQDFKNQNEHEAATKLHFGTGLPIRNSWGLWKGQNSLVKYFNTTGIFHPDDMSAIVLISFHRHLNNNPINLEEQVQNYVHYWKQAEEKERKWKEENKKEFENFNIGDSVKMNFSLRTDENKERVYLLSKNIDFAEKPYCVVTGVIRSKKILEKDNYTFVIEIMDICNRKEVKFGNVGRLFVGKTFEYSIAYNIERL